MANEPQALSTAHPAVDLHTGRLTPYLFNYLNNLWVRTGGFNDDVDTAQATALFDSRSAAEIGQLRKDTEASTRAAVLMDDSSALRGEIEELKKTITGLIFMIPESRRQGTLAQLDASSGAYTPSNESTSRSFDANDAAGSISVPPTQAEVENIRDAVLALADVVATLINDLQAEGIIQ